jgi:hypothetical protein
MNYHQTLMKMIERLLSGEWSVSKFENEYYDFYLEEVPDKALSAASPPAGSTEQTGAAIAPGCNREARYSCYLLGTECGTFWSALLAGC